MPPSPSLARVLDRLGERGHRVTEVGRVIGDVSRRRYVRLGLEGGQAVVALYPRDTRAVCGRYLATGELLAGAGVRVPAVLDGDCADGWLLLEDLGERTLYDHAARPWEELEDYFLAALEAAQRVRAIAPGEIAALGNPPLDAALLGRELAKTRTTFLEPRGLAGDDDIAAALDALCRRLGAEEPVPCHRDFGARNLMPLGGPCGAPLSGDRGSEPRVGVLDHQDLRFGPPAYDLASLLNDSLFPSAEGEERLLAAAGLASGPSRESYHRAAVQRTLKAIGSYAAYANRGRRRHLRLIAPTLTRTLGHAQRVPELAGVIDRLEALWRPVAIGRLPENV